MQPEPAVVSLPVAALVPYAENARTHFPAEVAPIATSIAEFGFVNPVLVDGAGVPINGHDRVMAAKQLGISSMPMLRLGHLFDQASLAWPRVEILMSPLSACVGLTKIPTNRQTIV